VLEILERSEAGNFTSVSATLLSMQELASAGIALVSFVTFLMLLTVHPSSCVCPIALEVLFHCHEVLIELPALPIAGNPDIIKEFIA